MNQWKEPETVFNEVQLKTKKIRYWRIDAYVYYKWYDEIIRTRCEGNESIMLYCSRQNGSSGNFQITEVKDGYVYFTKNTEYTYESDWIYQAERVERTYKVKTDESRELYIISEKEDYQSYGDDYFTEGELIIYDPPKTVNNPAKR